MLYTLGFPDNATLLFKFDKHVTRRKEFAYTDVNEYRENADRFLGAARDVDTEECFRDKKDGSVGDKIRYNRVTQEFGVLGNDNKIRSYYVPNPAPKPYGHGKGTNLKYFLEACNEVRG